MATGGETGTFYCFATGLSPGGSFESARADTPVAQDGGVSGPGPLSRATIRWLRLTRPGRARLGAPARARWLRKSGTTTANDPGGTRYSPARSDHARNNVQPLGSRVGVRFRGFSRTAAAETPTRSRLRSHAVDDRRRRCTCPTPMDRLLALDAASGRKAVGSFDAKAGTARAASTCFIKPRPSAIGKQGQTPSACCSGGQAGSLFSIDRKDRQPGSRIRQTAASCEPPPARAPGRIRPAAMA